jgi:predicted XRE-type DNA-binding protein
MMATQRESSADRIIAKRYGLDLPEHRLLMEQERTNAEVACLLYDMRHEAGMTQKELATLVGTSQSVISMLEDTDYQGHSLSMLVRIATALGHEIRISVDRRTA